MKAVLLKYGFHLTSKYEDTPCACFESWVRDVVKRQKKNKVKNKFLTAENELEDFPISYLAERIRADDMWTENDVDKEYVCDCFFFFNTICVSAYVCILCVHL